MSTRGQKSRGGGRIRKAGAKLRPTSQSKHQQKPPNGAPPDFLQLQRRLGLQRAQQYMHSWAKSQVSIQPIQSVSVNNPDNQNEVKSAQLQGASVNTLMEVLDGPPPPEKRDKPAQKRDLNLAIATIEGLVDKFDRAGLEVQFPALQYRFGLTTLEWRNDDTLEVKVNPSAQINLAGQLAKGDTSHSNDLLQNVSFKKGNLWGELVGIEMEAKILGPNHPQGGPPTNNALKNIMLELPTDPKMSAGDKYIKGHLLNDNLGGPGIDSNLFPITASANKQHESYVESFVKQWVNEKGGFAYYKVEVINQKEGKIGGINYINANFECTFDKLDDEGKRVGRGFKRTIASEYKNITNPTHEDVDAEHGAGMKTIKGTGFDPNKVEWSTSRGDPKQPQEVLPSIALNAQHILEQMIKQPKFKFGTALGKIEDLGLVLHPISKKALFHADYGFDMALSTGDIIVGENISSSVAVWNKAINFINTDDVSKFLIKLKKVVDDLSTINDLYAYESTGMDKRRVERDYFEAMEKGMKS